jgi:protein-L-isoaspartate(D-aspartate) O-methyltransferase
MPITCSRTDCNALARWIDATDIQVGEHVVHLGCGTGYYTVDCKHMVGPRGGVTAIEFDAQLAERAQANLQHFAQVEVIVGDATKCDPGPADAILVSAGATHPLPLWLDSLKLSGRPVFPMIRWPEGGRMGIGGAGWGVMMLIQRLRNGYSAKCLAPTGYFPCFGAVDPEADRRLGRCARQKWAVRCAQLTSRHPSS